ncbi:hypothetical protein [[Clostridium] aminophilum]|uniref:hypothetical protein n=1 Tax=[Clostridium] aminophilum TaxID=1526 RepID=UPI001A9A313B|nr:hypothetical protein [[Clostridium] aminophilum]
MLTETFIPKRKESDTPRARRQFSKEMQSESGCFSFIGNFSEIPYETKTDCIGIACHAEKTDCIGNGRNAGNPGMSGGGDECAAENEKMEEK